MNTQEFSKYFSTLHVNAENQTYYVPLPISDLEELGHMHHALIHAIRAINQLGETYPKDTENSIDWLCRILLSSYPEDELEGLSEWIKVQ